MVKKQIYSGINSVAALILVTVALFFTSCSKEEFLVEPAVTTEISSSSLRVGAVLPEVFGMYTHPNYLVIGSASSENATLQYLRSKGGNMFNTYARNSMTTSAERAMFSAFCRKAVN